MLAFRENFFRPEPHSVRSANTVVNVYQNLRFKMCTNLADRIECSSGQRTRM